MEPGAGKSLEMALKPDGLAILLKNGIFYINDNNWGDSSSFSCNVVSSTSVLLELR